MLVEPRSKRNKKEGVTEIDWSGKTFGNTQFTGRAVSQLSTTDKEKGVAYVVTVTMRVPKTDEELAKVFGIEIKDVDKIKELVSGWFANYEVRDVQDAVRREFRAAQGLVAVSETRAKANLVDSQVESVQSQPQEALKLFRALRLREDVIAKYFELAGLKVTDYEPKSKK